MLGGNNFCEELMMVAASGWKRDPEFIMETIISALPLLLFLPKLTDKGLYHKHIK